MSFDYSTGEIPDYDAYRPNGGIPVLQPCATLHGDLEFIYHVYLLSGNKFKITYQDTKLISKDPYEWGWNKEKTLTKKMLFPEPKKEVVETA